MLVINYYGDVDIDDIVVFEWFGVGNVMVDYVID